MVNEASRSQTQPLVVEERKLPSMADLPRLPPSHRTKRERKLPASSQSDADDLEEAPVEFVGDYYISGWGGWSPALVSRQIAEFDADFAMRDKRMHKFPPRLSYFLKPYGAQVTMPIGPHVDREFGDSSKVNIVKNVATEHFLSGTNFESFGDMYAAFCSEMEDARTFCDRTDHDLARVTDEVLKFNMLRDGCFLLQYMLHHTIGPDDKMPAALVCYFDANQAVIDRDIMLLGNQLPWKVIKTLREFKQVSSVDKFIAKMARTFQVRKGKEDQVPFALDDDRDGAPPHLLGFLRFYKLGAKTTTTTTGARVVPTPGGNRTKPICKIVSAIELAEIGIRVTANKTTKFLDMGISKGLFRSKIFLAPLLLDETRLCWLVNMAAFEQCVGTTFSRDPEKNAVCSYLVILAMLMNCEEDVLKLRSNGILQGELTDKETLDFFKAIVKHVSGGPLYIHLMNEIEDYRLNRWIWIMVHKFVYKNYKTITAVLSAVGVLVGIFKALFSLKQH